MSLQDETRGYLTILLRSASSQNTKSLHERPIHRTAYIVVASGVAATFLPYHAEHRGGTTEHEGSSLWFVEAGSYSQMKHRTTLYEGIDEGRFEGNT
ncbi:hypothetical protein PM082_011314 [Marasmius tenuissimus]|nr:hypothetical protein PM082_011314 [Marasmius tenuissimus]